MLKYTWVLKARMLYIAVSKNWLLLQLGYLFVPKHMGIKIFTVEHLIQYMVLYNNTFKTACMFPSARASNSVGNNGMSFFLRISTFENALLKTTRTMWRLSVVNIIIYIMSSASSLDQLNKIYIFLNVLQVSTYFSLKYSNIWNVTKHIISLITYNKGQTNLTFLICSLSQFRWKMLIVLTGNQIKTLAVLRTWLHLTCE